MKGRPRATLASATFSLALQFAAIMTFVLPHVAPSTSARDLAAYFNRTGRIPSRLLIANERIGSVVFYLDAELRAGLQQGQVQQVQLCEEIPMQPDTLIVLPEQRVEQAEEDYDLAGVPYESAGRHRIYEASEFTARLRTATASSGEGALR